MTCSVNWFPFWNRGTPFPSAEPSPRSPNAVPGEEFRSRGGRVAAIIMVAAVSSLVTAGGGLSIARGCTTAVISGQATADGRPLLWKNRDTTTRRNEVVVVAGGRYRAIAVVNAGSRKSVWMGANEAGFCIENSLSKDLRVKGPVTGPGNGSLMKRALQTCRTVEDFCQLLETTNSSGRTTTANFGVIDAQGGAALFECGPRSYHMFDANDPQVAPDGWIVRSNFATTAHDLPPLPASGQLSGKEIYSADRYLRACQLLAAAADQSAQPDPHFILRRMSRDLADETGRPVCGSVNGPQGRLPDVIPTGSTISRTTTVSAAVFHGVRPGEDPRLTTMWTVLGDPKFSIAVPCWPTQDETAAPLSGPDDAPIGAMANTIRDWTFTDDRTGVESLALPGIWQHIWPVEDRIIADARLARQEWLASGFDTKAASELHQRLAADGLEAMRTVFRRLKRTALSLPAPPPPDFAPVHSTILIP